jgi:hypothetical protein
MNAETTIQAKYLSKTVSRFRNGLTTLAMPDFSSNDNSVYRKSQAARLYVQTSSI